MEEDKKKFPLKEISDELVNANKRIKELEEENKKLQQYKIAQMKGVEFK